MTSNYTKYTDRELFGLIGEDDQRALAQLLKIYKPVIFGQAVVYMRNVTTAADVVQEVFLALWVRRMAISKMENPSGYLMTIARSKIMDELRKKVDEYTLDSLEPVLASPTSPYQAMEERERWQSVEAAIQRLPPQRKRIFELNKKEGLSYQEIADQLQISRETVKVHLVKAVAFLRVVLDSRLVRGLFVWCCLEKIFYH